MENKDYNWNTLLTHFTYEKAYNKILFQRFDFDKNNISEWLDVISKNGKWIDSYNEGLDAGQKRFLDKIKVLGNNFKLESGYLGLSTFCNIMIDREKITTETIDGIEFDDMKKDRYDFDYQVTEDNIQEVIHDINGYDELIPFSVITKSNADNAPKCECCNGKKFFKCDDCDGTGRKTYSEGNFANGEEKIKTGQCGNCLGTGKIECDECHGTGVKEMDFEQRQIVKRFEDRKYLLYYDGITSSWKEHYSPMHYNYPNYKYLWNDLDDTQLQKHITILHQSQNKVLLQNNIELGEYKSLFDINKKEALRYWKNSENKTGKSCCELEKHTVFPILRLTFDFEDCDYEIFILEYIEEDQKGVEREATVLATDSCFPSISFFKSLFLSKK